MMSSRQAAGTAAVTANTLEVAHDAVVSPTARRGGGCQRLLLPCLLLGYVSSLVTWRAHMESERRGRSHQPGSLRATTALAQVRAAAEVVNVAAQYNPPAWAKQRPVVR